LYDPDTKTLIDGAEPLFRYLNQHKRQIRLYLIGKGNKEMSEEVKRLGLKSYFRSVRFVPEQKQLTHFKLFMDKEDPTRTLVIGDRIGSEIEIGNRLGATTIRVRQGKFAKEISRKKYQHPDYIVFNLYQLAGLLTMFLEK
ncbi:MAG: HAD hydrolase-like protein, partial [Candidatus Saccharimonadales bacterium]